MSNPAVPLRAIDTGAHATRPIATTGDIQLATHRTPPHPSSDIRAPDVQARTAPSSSSPDPAPRPAPATYGRLHAKVMRGRQDAIVPQQVVSAIRLSWQAEATGDGRRKQLVRQASNALLEGQGKDARRFSGMAVRWTHWSAGFCLEQTHTDALRAVQVLFSYLALRIQSHPNATVRLAVEVLCSVLPTFLLNPVGTGSLRAVTDVFEPLLLPHGFPALSPGLTGAGDMDAAAMRRARLALANSRQAFIAAYTTDTPAAARQTALEHMVRDVGAMYAIANDGYKLSRGAYLASADGKAAGTAMNLLGASVPLLAFLRQFRWSFHASWILLLPQLLSGARDKAAMGTHYFSAGIELDRKSLILPQHRHLPAEDVRPEHVDPSAVRKRFDARTELPVKAIQEIALRELSNLLAEFDKVPLELEQKIAQRDTPGIARAEASLARQTQHLERWRQDLERFDSFDLDQWAQIDERGLGRHLDIAADHPWRLASRQMAARVDRPGEVMSQVTQRLKQLTGDAILSYVVMYIAAKVCQAFGYRTAGTALLIVGLLDWVFNTTQSRADKARDKPVLGRPFGTSTQIERDEARTRIPQAVQDRLRSNAEADPGVALTLRRVEAAGRWSARVNGEEKSLTGEAGYRRARPGTWSEVARRTGAVAGSAALSGPRGLWRLYRATRQRALCTAELRAVVDAAQRAGLAHTPGPIAVKNDDLPGLLARLEEFDAVRALRQRPPGAAVTSP